MLETLDFVAGNRDKWDQAEWGSERGCGTSHCYGGWALARSGARFAQYENERAPGTLVTDYSYVMADSLPQEVQQYLVDVEGWDPGDDNGQVDTATAAEALLGLGDWRASTIFAANNTFAMLTSEVWHVVSANSREVYHGPWHTARVEPDTRITAEGEEAYHKVTINHSAMQCGPLLKQCVLSLLWGYEAEEPPGIGPFNVRAVIEGGKSRIQWQGEQAQ
jgi:hypothetical protein